MRNFLCRELQIEPTNRCNLKCRMCSHALSKDLVEKDLSCQDFESIIKKFPTIERVFLQGLGEPFLNPELLDMVSLANKKGIFAYTTSNATLLDEPLVQKMISSGLRELRISLDTMNQCSYEKIRSGGKLESVIRNIEAIDRIKKERNSRFPVMKMNVVAMKDTIFDLPELIRFAYKMGIVEVSVIPLVVHGEGAFMEDQKCSFLSGDAMGALMNEACELSKRLNVELVSGISIEKHPESMELQQSAVSKCHY